MLSLLSFVDLSLGGMVARAFGDSLDADWVAGEVTGMVSGCGEHGDLCISREAGYCCPGQWTAASWWTRM
jgi:hypothetical protein